MIASVLVHSLIALLLLRHAIQWAEGGGGASGPRGGGGGGTDAVARYVQLPASPAAAPAAPVAPVAVPATPVPVPEPVQPEVIPPDEPAGRAWMAAVWGPAREVAWGRAPVPGSGTIPVLAAVATVRTLLPPPSGR